MNAGGVLIGVSKGYLVCAGIALLVFGLMKVTSHSEFLSVIESHGLAGDGLAVAVSWAVPLAEIAVGLMVVWGVSTSQHAASVSAVALTMLLAAMTLYAATLSANPPPAPVRCGCMPGSAPVESWWPVTLRNGLCTAVAGVTARILQGPRRIVKPREIMTA